MFRVRRSNHQKYVTEKKPGPAGSGAHPPSTTLGGIRPSAVTRFFFGFICLIFASPLLGKFNISFQGDEVGKFPPHFKTWPFQRGDAKKVYVVRQEGENKFLAADDSENLSEQVFRNFEWDIAKYPNFKWRWRARTLPNNAAENNPEKNDSACGVYILFGSRTSGTALKFIWSTTLPIGTVYEKTPGKVVMQAIDSGAENLNTWQSHSIHIPTFYKKLFKKNMDQTPTGFAILTDGNATETTAACDYDDFEISD